MKTFITSFNKKLYDKYAYRFIDSWIKFSGSDVNLVICYEGDLVELKYNIPTDTNIKLISIDSDILRHFQKKFGGFLQARGLSPRRTSFEGKEYTFIYNYRFDAMRFCFKVFSYVKCIELDILSNNFAWIDSDVVCLKYFNSQDLDEVFPDKDQLVSYIGRDSFPQPNPYSECGFIGYNFSSAYWKEFILSMRDAYLNGDIFLFEEWHDCILFDRVREVFHTKYGLSSKNIAADLRNQDHPFIHTKLGSYFDHLKGPRRKEIGHS
jgi:hypothetical protein